MKVERSLIFQAISLLMAVLIFAPAGAYQISVKQKPGKLRFSVIEEDSIYARAGIKRNDIVREINGKPVDDLTPVSEVEKVVLKGGSLKLERNGRIIPLKLKPMPQDD